MLNQWHCITLQKTRTSTALLWRPKISHLLKIVGFEDEVEWEDSDKINVCEWEMAITGSAPCHTVTGIVPSTCCYHTVAELYSPLFAVTFWPCQLSFCLCFYCPLPFDFLTLFCFYIQTARSHCISKSIFFMFCVTTWLSDEWIMNLKRYGWKHMCPNVVIRCTGRVESVRHYEGQRCWTCTRWQQSWYSGEICSCQLTVVRRGGLVSIVLFFHLTTLCIC
jgi:hypothetical protein